MTLEEFSFEFDVMYNNITSNQAPGLSELEKSVFLTQAQEAIVKGYYKGDLEQSFESTEEVTQYLNSLINQRVFDSKEAKNAASSILLDSSFKSAAFELPSDVMFITYESALVEKPKTTTDNTSTTATADVDKTTLLVVPTTQDEFFKILKNPFRGPNKRRALRLLSSNTIEIISKESITKYLIRYIKYPNPIVLPGSQGVDTYNDYSDGLEPELPESLHRTVLMQAVALAKSAWAS